MKKIISAITATFLSITILASCGAKASPNASNFDTSGTDTGNTDLKIVTTIFPYYDFARAVSGNTDNITMILKPGADAHTFDPSPADIIAVQEADVFIYTGGVDDAWAEKILSSANTSNMTIIKMLDVVTPLEEETVEGMEEDDILHDGHDHDHEDGHEHETEWDEHIWTSPKNAILMVNAISSVLQEKDSKNAKTYEKNATDYNAQIHNLDQQFIEIVANAKRKFFLFGGRFPFLYFAKEYGLTYRAAFPGCSTDTNPSASTVAYLIDVTKEDSLPYIFDIELSSGAIAKTISKETGAEVLTLQSCETVTADDFKNGETYVTLMQQNAINLEKGLN